MELKEFVVWAFAYVIALGTVLEMTKAEDHVDVWGRYLGSVLVTGAFVAALFVIR
jgi:hypothetical protein